VASEEKRGTGCVEDMGIEGEGRLEGGGRWGDWRGRMEDGGGKGGSRDGRGGREKRRE